MWNLDNQKLFGPLGQKCSLVRDNIVVSTDTLLYWGYGNYSIGEHRFNILELDRVDRVDGYTIYLK